VVRPARFQTHGISIGGGGKCPRPAIPNPHFHLVGIDLGRRTTKLFVQIRKLLRLGDDCGLPKAKSRCRSQRGRIGGALKLCFNEDDGTYVDGDGDTQQQDNHYDRSEDGNRAGTAHS
jgi:hypothetical protein